ncbi:hypothetical protein QFZ34_002205 [Phyllobacterium ifriqiyense]|uniref:Uncharacterized protein n=1 Tax=Phyllobacterium ifriqiyense TaxID=314238 RepID=A0ABU0S8E2_9HYPH|nr:hypothetical protein [Phyllobacterium ifriqiyense]MDQ0997023.1 hypothetical protein [Phyllobacterium ifriqiyense]
MTSNKIHSTGIGSSKVYATFDRYGLVQPEKQKPKKGSGLIQLSRTPFCLEIKDDWRVYFPTGGTEYSLQKLINRKWVEQRVATTVEELLHGIRVKVGTISGFAESLLEELPDLSAQE